MVNYRQIHGIEMPPIKTPMKQKPTLLLITGWAHGKEAMQPVADVLTAEYDIEILTGAQVLTDQSIPHAEFIITGSMGGLLALEHLPERCKKLVLISSTAKFCAHEGYPCGTPEKVLRRMILQLKRDPQAVLTEFFKNVHYPDVQDPVNNMPPTSPPDLESLVEGLEYLLHKDLRDRVVDIQIPVLLLHGAEDQIIPSSAAEWLNSHLPDSRLRIKENQGHALLAHHFDAVMDEISRFLQPK
jgi:pimeloyl-[acyl-carrier protein] methyl ester esterase